MYRSMVVRLLSVTCVAGCVTLSQIGCASSSNEAEGPKRAAATTETLEDYRTEVLRMQEQVDATLGSLNAVVAPGQTDARPAFAQFVKQLNATEKTEQRARSLAERMRARSNAYFESWDKELESVSNTDIRTRMGDRREVYSEKFRDTSEAMAVARGSYTPFLTDLNDLQKFLNNDLTPAGIEAAKDLVDRTTGSAGEVQQKLGAVIGELDEMIATFSPTTMPAPESTSLR